MIKAAHIAYVKFWLALIVAPNFSKQTDGHSQIKRQNLLFLTEMKMNQQTLYTIKFIRKTWYIPIGDQKEWKMGSIFLLVLMWAMVTP